MRTPPPKARRPLASLVASDCLEYSRITVPVRVIVGIVMLSLMFTGSAQAAGWESLPSGIKTVGAYCTYAKGYAQGAYAGFGAKIVGWRCGRVGGTNARPRVRVWVKLNNRELFQGTACAESVAVLDFGRHRSKTLRDSPVPCS